MLRLYLDQLLMDLVQNYDLFTPFGLSQEIIIEITVWISKLVLLSEDPAIRATVLEFILNQKNVLLTAKGNIIEGKMVNFDPYTVGTKVRKVTSDRGVYLWGAIDFEFQYVGSTINHAARRMDHRNKFLNNNLADQMQRWARGNGGLSALYWVPLCCTLNYYLLFLISHPTFAFNAKELVLLKAVTEFLPRVIEHFILKNLDLRKTGWNKQNYSTPHFLGPKTSAKVKRKSIEIKSLDTKIEVRPSYLNPSVAKDSLGLSNFYYSRYLNNKEGFYCPIFDQKVTLNEKGGLLKEKLNRKRLFFRRRAISKKKKGTK